MNQNLLPCVASWSDFLFQLFSFSLLLSLLLPFFFPFFSLFWKKKRGNFLFTIPSARNGYYNGTRFYTDKTLPDSLAFRRTDVKSRFFSLIKCRFVGKRKKEKEVMVVVKENYTLAKRRKKGARLGFLYIAYIPLLAASLFSVPPTSTLQIQKVTTTSR